MSNWKKIAIVAAIVVVVYFAVQYFKKKQATDVKVVEATKTPGNGGVVTPPKETITVVDAPINPGDFGPTAQ